MKTASDYFKTLVQVKRNGAAHLLDRISSYKAQNPEHISQLKGQVEAYNNVIQDIESYQLMAMEREDPPKDITREDPHIDHHKMTTADN
jgi:hypothetical protein